MINEGFWEWDLVSDRLYLNGFCRELTGYTTDDIVFDTSFLKSIIFPDDQREFFEAVRYRSQDATDTSSIGFRLLTRNGDIRWAECSSSVVGFDENGDATRIVGRLVDSAEHKQTENQLHNLNRALLAISSCNQAMLRANNELQLLNDICHIIVEIGGYRMVWVGYAQDDPKKSVRPVAKAGMEDGYLELLDITWKNTAKGQGPVGTAIRKGRPSVVRNIQKDTKFKPWRNEALIRGYASILSIPLKNGTRVFGALTIYSATPNAFDVEETKLLTTLADNMAYGITILQNRKAKEMAEDELRQSEERYRSLFQNRHTAMLIIEPGSGSIIDANPAAVSYYGWGREQLCRMNISEINTLSDDEIKAEMKKARKMDCNLFPFSHRLADGTIREVEVVSGPITIRGKSLLYSIVNDVTERNRAQSQLIEGSKRMHYILATTKAGIWESGTGLNAAIWSDEIWRLYGLDPHSCEPSTENWLNTIIPEDREEIREQIIKTKRNGTELNCMWRVRDPDGSIRWLLAKGTPFKDSEGKRLGYMGIVIDITDRKKEEEEKQHLEAQLFKAQRLETIGTLAGGIAHDFNNILTPILGYAEMGRDNLHFDQAEHDYFNEIMLAAERAKTLISQILTFSRAQKITLSRVSIQGVVTEALKLLRASIPATVTIDKEMDDACGQVLADPSQIHQVIVNLCTNAFQAMGENAGVITIALEEIMPSGELLKSLPEPHAKRYAHLIVSDTGTGMDESVMERIFEPFFTTKSINKGTGLGLSVVHGIISNCNGQINVDSQPGKGTTFNIYLPVIEGQKSGVAEQEHLPEKGSGRVLFVDDEEASTRMMTIMLGKLGYSIQATNSPLQALELFRKNPDRFDLVITDLTMPEMTGIDLADELQSLKPGLPIILMTGYSKDLENVKALRKHGIRSFMKKPVKMARISSAIKEVIPGHGPEPD